MRSHITPHEFEQLLAATTHGRHSVRDRLLLLLMYQHGLRVSEATRLTRADIDVFASSLYVTRLKRGLSAEHPLLTETLAATEEYLSIRPPCLSDNLFVSERGTSLTRQQVFYLVRRYGRLAKLPLPIHPHMLRHGCGYALANRGADTRLIQDYLGHKSIQSTVRYTATNARRFASLWPASADTCVTSNLC